jgi:amidohydrolase
MSIDVDKLKAEACARVDALHEEIVAICREIWEDPELGLQEHHASSLLSGSLERHGLIVERGIGGMATALRCDIGERQPRVAVIAEYDALPGVGHGCGHNVIAASGLGATLALAAIADRLPGSVRLLGTPAEESAVENAGGKVPILREGHFDDVDAAVMIHPGSRTLASLRPSLAARALKVEFFGRSAHAASSPHQGINALDAVLLTFNGINALRQHVRSDVRIHGVITHGGDAPNVIPAYAAARLRVRALDAGYLTEVYRRVLACAEGAAAATGARLEWREDVHPYHNTIPNKTIATLLEKNLDELGIPVDRMDNGGTGSTDFGNVSHKVPACHAYLAIAPPGTPGHSLEICEAAGSPAGMAAALNGAKLLAATAIDLILNSDALERARQEFEHADRLTEL